MTPEDEFPIGELYERCLERDSGCALYSDECSGGIEMAHILSRRKMGANCLANVVMLCPYHHRLQKHGTGVHSHEAKRELLNLLRDRHGYDYGKLPRAWQEALGEME